MAEYLRKNEELVLDDSIKLNKKGEAILGVLEGPCADVINPTRNERKYDEDLWNRVFSDPIVSEYFDCGGILGELDHPADRLETDTSKVAICMPERPKKGKDGKLYARFDILDTPNGRIAYTLAKYGYKLGVSSRGDGDVYESFDGKEHVDSRTYELKAFDLVLLPAVKAARLTLKESVGNKTFKQALKESLEKANPDERLIMEQSLRNLNIDYKQDVKPVDNIISTEKDTVVQPNEVKADNDGLKEIMEELQRQIKINKDLSGKLESVQEELSVCHAKEAQYEETLEELTKKSIESKENETEIQELNEKINSLTESLNDVQKANKVLKVRVKQLTEAKLSEVKKVQLNESVVNESKQKDATIKRLNEQLTVQKSQAEEEKKALTEQLSEVKKNSEIKTNEYKQKIQKANKIVEHYKTIAKTALDKYIDSKALQFSLTSQDIKNRLNENYTFDDIDSVCETLGGYQLNMSKLPINLQSTSHKVKVTESVEPITKVYGRFDDEVDESLLYMAGL